MAQFEHHVAFDAATGPCQRVLPGLDLVLFTQLADMPEYHALVLRRFAAHTNVRW
ncbi:MAG: hypothetical protein ACI83P_000605 [Janthinobacterium sp.]|jgi:hypothetical protein